MESSVGNAITSISGSSSTTTASTTSKNMTKSKTSNKDSIGTTVLSIVSVTQDDTTYIEGTDFSLANGNTEIAWGIDTSGNALSNAKTPASASVYVVEYTYSSSTSLGTYSASVSSSVSDNTYISLSLKSMDLVIANKDTVKDDIDSFVELVFSQIEKVVSSIPSEPTNVTVSQTDSELAISAD